MNSRRVSVVGLAFVLLMCSSPSFATDGGFFVAGALGQSEFRDYELESVTSDLDDSDSSGTVGGGYVFMKHFGAMLSFVDLGELNASGPGGAGQTTGPFVDTISADGIALMPMGFLPFNEKLTGVAGVGMFFWNQDVTYSDTAGPFTASPNGSSPCYRLSLHYDAFRDNGIGFHVGTTMYMDVGDLEVSGHENDVLVYEIGASYEFGAN